KSLLSRSKFADRLQPVTVNSIMSVFPLHRFQLVPAAFPGLFHKKLWKGLDNAHGEVSLRPTPDLPAETRVRPLCPQVSWELSCAAFLLLRSIAVHGVRPVDRAGQPARHRNRLELAAS